MSTLDIFETQDPVIEGELELLCNGIVRALRVSLIYIPLEMYERQYRLRIPGNQAARIYPIWLSR